MKKGIIFIISITLIIVTFLYFKPFEIQDLEEIPSEENLPNSIKASVYVAFDTKEHEVRESGAIKELIEEINHIKIRKLLNEVYSWRPKVKETYTFEYEIKNEIIKVDILSKNYVRINNRNEYKITDDFKLAKLYEIIILSQPEGSLDEYYYNLIDS